MIAPGGVRKGADLRLYVNSTRAFVDLVDRCYAAARRARGGSLNGGIAVEELLEKVNALREQANLTEVFDSKSTGEMACCTTSVPGR